MARVRLNGAGIRALLNDPGVVAHLESRMGRAEAAAKSSAPVESGEYERSIRTWTDKHPDRTSVHMGSDVDYAMEVEARTGNLSRALDSAGGS